MRTPTLAGQFRKVKYTDDGCSVYSCCWCDQQIEIRSNPDYWNFCPGCGKSWFTRLQCREHNRPRWHYDLGEDCRLPYFFYENDVLQVVIEERTKWPDKDWSDWSYEGSRRINFGQLGIWSIMKSHLEFYRSHSKPRFDGETTVKFEYRARLERI